MCLQGIQKEMYLDEDETAQKCWQENDNDKHSVNELIEVEIWMCTNGEVVLGCVAHDSCSILTEKYEVSDN